MPLSEREERLLAEIDHALSAENPRLDSQLRARRAPRWRCAASGLARLHGALLGLALVAAGIYDGSTVGTVVALLGYCIIVVSIFAMVAQRLTRRRDRR